MPAADRRLYLKCCGAQSKEECTWAPCPANIDQWSPEELRQLISENPRRVYEAKIIWSMDPSEGGVPLDEIEL